MTDLVSIRRLSKIGLFTATAFGAAVLTLTLRAMFFGRWDVRSVPFAVVSVCWMITGTMLMFLVGAWVAKVFRFIRDIRQLPTGPSTGFIGMSTGLSFLVGFIPLIFALGLFTKRTHPGGNGTAFTFKTIVFALAAFVAYSAEFIPLVMKIDFQNRATWTQASNLSLVYALLTGCMIVFEINANLGAMLKDQVN